MLYIENIDGNSVRFGNGYGGGEFNKVYPKTMEARKDEIDRIWIWHTENNEAMMNVGQVSESSINGVTYGTAEEFVVAFNNLMKDDTPFVITTTTTTTVPVTTTTTTGA